jgi:hypothetical protein
VNLPFEVTEERDRCDHYDPLRQPFFGTTHNHTGRSFDAALRRVSPGPRDSYRFMKRQGEEGVIEGVNNFGLSTRKYQLNRPLDWGMVTDHSEHFGEVGLCKGDNKELPGYYSLECRLLRNDYFRPASFPLPQALRTFASSNFIVLTAPALGARSLPARLPVCINNPETCDSTELSVWEEMQAAAEEAYDRSSECTFTSFVAYENTSTPGGTNWHRNVIFRNENVIKSPIDARHMGFFDNPDPNNIGPLYITSPGPNPAKFWRLLESECLEGMENCDVLSIPHNPNLGGTFLGVPALFGDPVGLTKKQRAQQARLRVKLEPLVEIFQAKGGSECRYDPRYKNDDAPWKAQTGLNPADQLDEDCAFEILDGRTVLEASGVVSTEFDGVSPEKFDDRSYVRNILKAGLQIEDEIGVNPFKLGVGAASDNHNATGGWHPENPYSDLEKGPLSSPWNGHLGLEDAEMTRSRTIQNNSGGHWVAWAEENSRDSIFEALRRRETYGTSGPRHVVRFFGGWKFKDDLCSRNYVKKGYKNGVPMGGELESLPKRKKNRNKSPRFILAASFDEHLGTPLQQIQIIKGWLDKDGETHESVYVVAGDPKNGATVDTDCTQIRGTTNYESLCTVWEDPDFDPDESAFYYGRVIENPVCRISTNICQQKFGVNPLLGQEECKAQLAGLGLLAAGNAAACCSDETTTPFVQQTIQERSWTSPIWYNP